MKSTITYDFNGCFEGCPHSSNFMDCNVLPMRIACMHDSFDSRNEPYPTIMGGTRSSCILKNGEKYPEWCPVHQEEVNDKAGKKTTQS